MNTKLVFMPSEAGSLEVAIDCAFNGAPSQDLKPVKGLAVVAHPHPLFGGARDNKVVVTMGRALTNAGFHVLRPNFRGVGDSSGVFDGGEGESLDLVNLIKQCSGSAPPVWWPNLEMTWPSSPNWVLAGFSFGAYVQAKVFNALATGQAERFERIGLILVGTAVSRFPVPSVPSETFVVHGEQDDVVALSEVINWARPKQLPIVVVPGAGHFFHGALPILKGLMTDYLRSRYN